MVVADVRVSEILDRIVITPRDLSQINELNSFLRRALPGVRLHLSAEGVWVAAHEAYSLLQTIPSVDLRWDAEARLFAENRNRVRESRPALIASVRGLIEGGARAAIQNLKGIRGLEPLDEHQIVNVASMTLPESYGLCIFDEQGAGKTVTFIFAFDVLVERDYSDFALIVAPKSMVGEWPQDFKRFKGDLYRVQTVTGTRQEKGISMSSGADVLVTNFETAVTMEDELRALLRGFQGRATLVIDESFFIKNLNAKRTQALRRLREWCGRTFVLCGTPAPNSPHDLVQQFNIVDFGLTFSGIEVPDDNQEARSIVQRAIEGGGPYIRHLKRDVLPNLPAKRFNRILVSFQPQQERLYLSTLNNLISELSSTTEEEFRRNLMSYLAKKIALLQICSNPVSLVRGYSEVPAKQLALDELLKEIILIRDEKVILWSFFTASIDALVSRYGSYCPVRYDGTVNDIAVRREAVRKFQEDDETMLFIANPAAAGAGLTLHRAHFAIYESMSNQAAHYLQSLDRIHRRGQTKDVEYLVLLSERSIEVEEYERLIAKERTAQELLGDQVIEPVTRELMLSDLLKAKELFVRSPLDDEA